MKKLLGLGLIMWGSAANAQNAPAPATPTQDQGEARQFGILTKGDRISMNPDRLIGDAKDLALSLAPGYTAGIPRTDIKVGGENALARCFDEAGDF